jgi:hypothetical protein
LTKGLGYSDGAKGGRPPFDPVAMFKVLVVQAQRGPKCQGTKPKSGQSDPSNSKAHGDPRNAGNHTVETMVVAGVQLLVRGCEGALGFGRRTPTPGPFLKRGGRGGSGLRCHLRVFV